MSKPETEVEDLTRKQRREQARAGRKAAEEAAAKDAVRRKRLTQLGGAAVVVVVAVVVILIATGSGGKSKVVAPKSAKANQEVSAVKGLLSGISQVGNVLGNQQAPLTMQYFGDLECPVCAEFTAGALPSIIKNWVKPGKLKIEYRSFGTASVNAEREGAEPTGMFNTQQVAALAAGKQNKAWEYIELFYHEQGEEDSGYVTEKYLQGIAQQVPGLDLAKWTSDRADPKLAEQVNADAQEVNNRGFKGTPSFLIGKSGDTLTQFEYTSLSDAGNFEAALAKDLKS